MCVLSREEFVSSFFFFSSRRRHTRFDCDWSSDVCSSDLLERFFLGQVKGEPVQPRERFFLRVVRVQPPLAAKAARLVLLTESEGEFGALHQHFHRGARRNLEVLAVEAIGEDFSAVISHPDRCGFSHGCPFLLRSNPTAAGGTTYRC